MAGLDVRELEAFIALADELHFGRAGERLYLSQSRVSQLLRSLESKVGARLVERTSRRVRLTPLGEKLLADVRPAYDTLVTALDDARAAARGVRGLLRIGFQGTVNEQLMDAITVFQRRHPDCVTEVAEIAYSDPFGQIRRNDVDVAVVLLPVEEPDLVLAHAFSASPHSLALPTGHPHANRRTLTAEDLAEFPLIGPDAPAPDYWRRAQAPTRTPGGLPIPHGPSVSTLQEGLSLVAAGRGAMLLCHPTAEYHSRRGVTYVPVTGLGPSTLGLVWSQETARTRAFAQALIASTSQEPGGS